MPKPTSSDRARMKRELEVMLDAIGEEAEALKPLLLSPKPPPSAVALHRALSRMSIETREMLLAMRDAESETTH
jgi:hypothetical protein